MTKTLFLIVGKHAVIEALKNPKRRIYRVYLTEDSKKNLNRKFQSANWIKNTRFILKSRKELDNLCGRGEISHQGLVAEAEELENLSLKDFLLNNDKKDINFIALEDVTDPRNIGSIIRSAVSFNIDGIIVKERSFPSKSKLLFSCYWLFNYFFYCFFGTGSPQKAPGGSRRPQETPGSPRRPEREIKKFSKQASSKRL